MRKLAGFFEQVHRNPPAPLGRLASHPRPARRFLRYFVCPWAERGLWRSNINPDYGREAEINPLACRPER